ncbi:sigma-54-dependent transcriptional regulator [Alteromonas facilis]|uniref:sigma-54-dependent transcriptional regulator n=1 Tax=Alteromonas facilis TaxID=2048004 RepID=UPI000C289186|nr:sigma-54 dependent transcriptional regulator [Alteromonas facilis]
MQIQKRILLVDDESSVLSSLKRVLRPLDMDISVAETGIDALRLLEKSPVDIVISDLTMPGMSGVELCSEIAAKYPETIRIMLTAHAESHHILEAINTGRVWGYLQKPWDNQQLLILIQQAFRDQELQVERQILKKTLERYQKRRRKDFAGFIGDSIAMQFVYRAIEKSAPSTASVFITGESGTGKEVAAEAIHNLSKRKNDPFIALNCAAIPSELMESEIFGHVKGAFSGAVSNRDGAATLAHEGTLFLDELGEMDISLQAKILRFIQTGTFKRVGSSKEEKVNVRFLCATNREPEQAIKEQKLREDLYYRLSVISIDLPPLREREEDVIQIASHFLRRYSALEEKEFVGFTADAEALLRHYRWPGNVRQLQNAIHSSIIMSEGPLVGSDILGNQLGLNRQDVKQLSVGAVDVPDPQKSAEEDEAPSIQPRLLDELDKTDFHSVEPLAVVERKAIENALTFYHDNVVKAATALGVSPSTLYRKMQSW